MEFGKLANVNGVDFSMPEDDPENARTLGGERRQPLVYVGSPAWGDPNFVDKIYPTGTKPRDFLKHYAQQFGAVELNSTYYGVREDSIRRWAELTPPEFRFCPKFPGAITHEHGLRGVEAETEAFFAAILGFGERLGLPWLVLPPTFGPESFGVLQEFVSRFGPERRMAIELRHAAWFQNRMARSRAFELFERHGVVALITDVAGRRDVLHMRLTSTTAMLRIVGNQLHPSDFPRLDAWAERLGRWCDQGLETAYVFLHQPADHLTVELAEHFVPKLNAAAGLELSPPRRVEKREQGMLF